jgi:DNA-binding NtrC family response regulator
MEDKTTLEKTLIIDDDASVRRTLERIIKKIGRDYISTDSAEDASRIMQEQAFDLILCDIRLPGESGLTLIHKVLSEHP